MTQWQTDILLESERLARLDDYLDDREPEEEPMFLDEED